MVSTINMELGGKDTVLPFGISIQVSTPKRYQFREILYQFPPPSTPTRTDSNDDNVTTNNNNPSSSSSSKVTLCIGNGTIFHPKSKLLILLPQEQFVDDEDVNNNKEEEDNNNNNNNIKLVIKEDNIFEECCHVTVDLSTLPPLNNNKLSSTIDIIGRGNVFAPFCCINIIRAIGNYNIIQAKSVLQNMKIGSGCVFAPSLQFNGSSYSSSKNNNNTDDDLDDGSDEVQLLNEMSIYRIINDDDNNTSVNMKSHLNGTLRNKNELSLLLKPMAEILQTKHKLLL